MIDDYRGLSDGALMRQRGLFVAEGRLVVRRALEDPRYRIHSVLLNEASHRELADALARLATDVPVYVRSAEALLAITGHDFHRGCLALVHRPAESTIESIVNGPVPVVMLEEVTDADNVGGVFRNAAAFGVGGVILSSGCCDPFYRKAVRTSMATVLQVPFARATDWAHAIRWLRAHDFVIASLTPHHSAEPIDEFAGRVRGRKLAVVIGSEGGGLSDRTIGQTDARVRIPMTAGVDSLNLSVAAAIALFALRSRDAHQPRSAAAAPPTSPDQKTAT
jgi:tRNA G18 (ribose-2'-O)-methylase SpoU